MSATRVVLSRGLVLLGTASLVFLGGTGPTAAVLGCLGVCLCWWARGRGVRETLWRVGLVCAVLGAALGPLLFAVPWGLSGIGLILLLQVHRARVGRAPEDDRIAALFALLTVLLAATRARSVGMGLILGAFVLGLPPLLLAIRLDELAARGPVGLERIGRRGRLLASASAASAVLCGLFFVFIPRLNIQALAIGDTEVLPGYGGDRVDLGMLGEAKTNEQLVMRVTVTDANGVSQRGPFYFRGTALDEFDGRGWRRSPGAGGRTTSIRPQSEPAGMRAPLLRQEILMEPLEAAPVFAIPMVKTVFTDEMANRDTLGTVHLGPLPTARALVIWSDPRRGAGFGGVTNSALLALPEDLDPRIQALAWEIAGDHERTEQAARLESWLRENMRYTLVPSAANSSQPLTTFLFESREGHCEYFATALAVMLRSVGIPSVLNIGFYGGDWNAVGGYIAVRQSHAHAWVEAEVAPGRWIRLDATPSGTEVGADGGLGAQVGDMLVSRWQRWILDYDLDRQASLVLAVGAALNPDAGAPDAAPVLPPALAGGAVLLVLLGVAGVQIRRVASGDRSPTRRGPAGALHARARRLVARRGWRIPSALPPVEAARWLRAQAGPAAAPLEELAWIHYEERYAGRSDATRRDRARACLKALNDLPPAPESSR